MALSGVVLCLLLASASPAEARRYASIVIDAVTGRTLHEANPDRWVYPASLTKMMTMYMTFDALADGRLTLKKRLLVSRRAAGMTPSKLWLRVGDTITVDDALAALATKSANDAAVVLAEAIGGTEQNFARMMTEKAKSLGMRRTTFRNASGLPNRHQRSTARDQAALARALVLHHSGFYHYFSRKKFSYRGRNYGNHNKLLKSYPGVDGIKTGYISAAGYNLVASAVRDNRRIIAVVIGGRTSKSRDRHMVELLDHGFERAKTLPAVHFVRPSPRRPVRDLQVADAAGATSGAIRGGVSASRNWLPPVPKRRPSTANPGEDALTTALAEGVLPAPRPVDVAPSPAASPQPVARGGTAIAGAYAVQVGAFSRRGQAEAAARLAGSRLPDLLAGTRVELAPIRGRGGLIYRARRVGLSAGQAERACLRLKQLGEACLVVRVTDTDVATGGGGQASFSVSERLKADGAVRRISLIAAPEIDESNQAADSSSQITGPETAGAIRPSMLPLHRVP